MFLHSTHQSLTRHAGGQTCSLTCQLHANQPFSTPPTIHRHCHNTLLCKSSHKPHSRHIAMHAQVDTQPMQPTTDFVVPQEYIDAANQLADVAAQITVPYFRTKVAVDTKGDASPVTIADREAESAMRKLLGKLLPEHAVFGEEEGFSGATSGGPLGGPGDFVWVLDPIDGTKSFITGQPISTRSCGQLSSAYMYSTTPLMFTGAYETAYNALRDKVAIPLYGCDCYAYGLLACGFCDLVVEADMKPYDYMALVPVVQGAGGAVTDWQGNPLTWHATEEAVTNVQAGTVLAAGDMAIHQQALKVLQEAC